MDVQLVHDLLPVLFNRFNANAQFGCDLLVRPAFGNELQHFCLPRREVISSFAARLSIRKGSPALIAQPFGYRWTKISVAALGFANCPEQLIAGRLDRKSVV